MGSSRVPWFDDWQEPAEQSHQRKAVSEPFEEVAYSKELRKPVIRRLEIVKPLHGDPYLIYAKTGIKYAERKCTMKDMNKVKRWKKY